MGFGMSRVMIEDPNQTDILIGMIIGIIGLLICAFNYPIYTYIKTNRD